MSLDFANNTDRAFTRTATADLTTLTAANFDGGMVDSASRFAVLVDTTAGSVDASTLPTTLVSNGKELFKDGVEVVLINATGGNTITFTDPLLSVDMSFADKAGERLTLFLDDNSGAPRWVS